jgi:hypothetical protein
MINSVVEYTRTCVSLVTCQRQYEDGSSNANGVKVNQSYGEPIGAALMSLLLLLLSEALLLL